MLDELSDILGDLWSQLPYQEFSPYYLAPMVLSGISHFPDPDLDLGLERALSLSVLLPTSAQGTGVGEGHIPFTYLAILATHMDAIKWFFP